VKPRQLQIEITGDNWRGRIKPRIRISGRWLERAGFPPGQRVEVIESAPGVLTLRRLFTNPPDLPKAENHPVLTRSQNISFVNTQTP
jgi:hypothetical protein